MCDLSAMEARLQYEEQTRLVSELQNKVADAEDKLIEGDKLRKKLHNTILVALFSLLLHVNSSKLSMSYDLLFLSHRS